MFFFDKKSWIRTGDGFLITRNTFRVSVGTTFSENISAPIHELKKSPKSQPSDLDDGQ